MANKTVSISFKIDDGNGGLKKVTMDAAEFRKMMNATVKEVEAVKKSLFNFTSMAVGISTANNALSQFMNTLNDFTADSRDFTNAMRATNTMAGKSAEDFDKLKDSVSELSKSVPVAREQLAQGLYQVISNGVPEDNWLSFLEASARSSVGGIADLGQTVGVTSTLIKNYGLAWSDAASIQDKIQLTAKNGVTSFEQLASALPRVAGNAATLGVSIDDLMASFATLTGVSGNTAEVSTQIAAIFTALVKPSSEAGKMAEAMGIQFDAAAIKAAGGFSAFLTQLDSSVKAYAQSSGVLEQEIYGKLFGSAESLRALIPLTGELREKFQSNIAAMKGSAGTMDEAFTQMANTSDAKAQKMKNSFAMIGDAVNTLIAPIRPMLSLGSATLQAASNFTILLLAIKPLKAQILVPVFNAVTRSCRLLGSEMRAQSVQVRMFGATWTATGAMAKAGAMVVNAAAWTIKRALITTGIGAAVWALGEGLAFVVEKLNGVSDSAKKAAPALDEVAQAQKAEADQMKDIRAQIALHISELENFSGSKEKERAKIAELNSTYGKQMGYFSSLSDWYKALTKNSEAYCRQMVAEIRARSMAEKIAKLDEDIEKRERTPKIPEKIPGKGSTPTLNGSKPAMIVNPNAAAYNKAFDNVTAGMKKKREAMNTELSQLLKTAATAMPVKGSDINPDLHPSSTGPAGKPGKGEPIAPKGSIADLEKQIGDIDKKIKFSIDPDSIMTLTSQKEALQKQIGDLEVYTKIATSGKWSAEVGKELDKRPLALPVKIDKDQLTSALQDIPKQFKKVNAESGGLGETLGSLGNACRDAGAAFGSMGQAFEMPELNIMGTIAQAIAQMILSFGQALTKTMSPWEWIAFGISGLAQLTGMIATVKNIGKFADGGIAYGPTLGLFGEYAGASSNPEVVAPLDKLRSMLPAGNAAPVIIGGDIRIKGGDLVVALRNVTGAQALTGRRSGIQ